MKLTLKNKVLAAIAGLFVVALVATSAHADGATLYVAQTAPTTIPDGDTLGSATDPFTSIQAAIDAAQPGDTISVAAGTYTEAVTVNKSVTITGAGRDVTTLQVSVPNNGFSISANDVTISGFDIEGPANLPYTQFAWAGDITRGIAISNGVQNFTISNNKIANTRNNILVDGRNTGSIIGNILDNSKSAISVQYTDGTGLTISGNTQGTNGNEWGVNLHLNGHDDGTGNLVANSVKIAPAATTDAQSVIKTLSSANANWTVQDQGYSTSNRTAVYVATTGTGSNQGSPLNPVNTIQLGVDGAIVGGTVYVNSNLTESAATTISKNVTVEGQTHTLTAAFAKTDNSNNAGIIILGADGATIKDLIVDGTTGTNLHGINVVSSTNVTLNAVTLQDNKRDGLVVNGSTVTVNNITTANNAWGGIDVDQGSGITTPATLTVNGTSAHNETVADILVDDNAKTGVSVIGSTSQYSTETYTHDGSVEGTKYTLKTAIVGTEAAFKAAVAKPLVSTIIFNNDITIATSQVSVSRPVTIDGAGHKLFGSFVKTNGSNNSPLTVLNTSGVTIKNLVEDGTAGTNLHGINIFKSTDVTLNNVTVSNNQHNGLSINSSTVTLTGVTTANNGWGGIDLDQPADGLTLPTVLTISGTMHQTESVLDIFRDNNAKDVTLVDSNNLYVATSHDNGDSTTGTIFTLIDQKEITNSNPLPITSSTEPINVTVGSTVVDPKIDVSSLVVAGTATLPQISVLSDDVNVNVSAGTTVTSTGPTTWNGVINAPTVTTSYTLTPEVGTTATAVLALEVGAGDIPLVFSDAVKLTFPGQADNLIGWSQNGTFHAITDTCDSATAPTLAAGADCRINVGSDLVVWTKHFTTFVTYTQTAVATSTGGVSGGGGSAAVSTTVTPTATTAPVGQVLGAESFNFTLSLSNGAKGDEVMQLQTRLNADGATLTIDGKFGPKTKAALVKWQKAHKLSADGKVGPKTRAELNK